MTTDWKPTWQKAHEWHSAGLKVGLATVVETWGSSPRPVGSHLVMNETGLMEGSVSGGCVEAAVITALETLIASDKTTPEILDFGVTNEKAWDVGLSCGGRIRVLLETMGHKFGLIEDVLTTTENRVLVTDLLTGQTDLAANTDALVNSTLVESGESSKFYQLLAQPLELIIIGAVHISQAMVSMAEELGIAVSVIDPRTLFAHDDRFAGLELDRSWPDDALKNRDITSSTAIVTLTHDPKLDDAALAIALKSPAFYVASLGSRKTHAARVERLAAMGFSDADIRRINGPAGLNIGAKTPSEIALSILAQMVNVYRGGGIS